MNSKDDLAPQNFKPLNDFVLQEVSEEVRIFILQSTAHSNALNISPRK